MTLYIYRVVTNVSEASGTIEEDSIKELKSRLKKQYSGTLVDEDGKDVQIEIESIEAEEVEKKVK